MCPYHHKVPLQDVYPEHHVHHVSQVILVNHGFGVSELIDVQEDLDELAEGRLCLELGEHSTLFGAPRFLDSESRE